MKKERRSGRRFWSVKPPAPAKDVHQNLIRVKRPPPLSAARRTITIEHIDQGDKSTKTKKTDDESEQEKELDAELVVAKDIDEISDISKKYKIKPGHKMEPVIFEPQKKIRLSRSTYKVNSYIDFKPYKETFKQFGHYMVRFLKDIHDPHYVRNLYNINRPKGSPPIKLGQSDKLHFGTPTCKQVTYKCRIQNRYAQLRKEAFKLDSMYKSAHEKFLRAIHHMEFHPTLGRSKERPEVRLKRQTQRGLKRIQTLKQIKKMTRQDIEMSKRDRWMVKHTI